MPESKRVVQPRLNLFDFLCALDHKHKKTEYARMQQGSLFFLCIIYVCMYVYNLFEYFYRKKIMMILYIVAQT